MQTKQTFFIACLITGLLLFVALRADVPTHPYADGPDHRQREIRQLNALKNAVADARAIAEALRVMGYGIRLVTDATQEQLRREIRQFASASATRILQWSSTPATERRSLV